MSTFTATSNRRDPFLAPLTIAAIMTLFLFYIDEGYYDFRWMGNIGNWIMFFVYLFVLFPVPWLIARFLLKNYDGWKYWGAIALIGIPVTLGLLWGVTSLI